MLLFEYPGLLFFVICVVLLLSYEIGFRLRARNHEKIGQDGDKQIEETRNQIAVLLSLLIGFTLSMALTRFDYRKQLVVDEANAIGTTYLRAMMQPEPTRTQASGLLRDYVDTRIAMFGDARADAQREASAKHSKQIQDQLWAGAVAASKQSPTPITSIYVQALNEMIDMDGKRVAATANRIPSNIWFLLGILSIMTTIVVGYGQRRRAALTTFVPVLTIAIALSLIADLDTPTHGLIRVDQRSLQSLSVDLKAGTPAAGHD
jgi:uncharacterized membrane protein YoaK (UPF0700 family)